MRVAFEEKLPRPKERLEFVRERKVIFRFWVNGSCWFYYILFVNKNQDSNERCVEYTRKVPR